MIPVFENKVIDCQVGVMGAGMAGMAAAVFASSCGLSTIQTGTASQMSFASGCLDLFSRIPGNPGPGFEDPFEGIEALVKREPDHPYARIRREEIVQGFETFTDFMNDAGISYHRKPNANQKVITPAGTLKSTWYVPSAMAEGSRALDRKNRILIVDIKGLKGFCARQMAQSLKGIYPWMGSVTLGFPGRENQGDLMCERLAWDFETPGVLARFIDGLSPHVSGFDAVGLPPILGLYRFEHLRAELEKELGKPVFEIPSLAPSVTGMRIKEGFSTQISHQGVRSFPVMVDKVTLDSSGRFCFKVAQGMDAWQIRANTLVLATGRFLGRGLGVNGAGRIKEQVFNLPVAQTDNRSNWFHPDFFNVQGHPVNRAGIETDEFFRPLDGNGQLFHPGLYAAGTIMAHQDWKREKSGSGISISTAYKAVSHLSMALTPL